MASKNELRERIEALERAVALLRRQVWELQQQAGRPPWSRRGLTPVETDE